MTDTLKFSAFTNGEEVQVGDEIAGLRSSANYRFDFPGDGIKDENGNYLYKYSSSGVNAVNFMQFTSADTGNAVILSSGGSDANIDIDVQPKGSGKFNINSSVGIDSIIDDDTMATATDTNVPTSESVVAYIAATPGGAGGSNTEIQYNNSGTLAGDSGFTTDGAGTVAIVGQLTVDLLTFNGNNIQSTSSINFMASTPTYVFQASASAPAEIRLRENTTNGLEYSAIRAASSLAASTAFILPDANPTANNQLIRAQTNGTLSYTDVTINSSNVLSGATQLNVDNLRLDGNTISSTDTAGNINITPDTTGDLILDGLKWPQTDGSANQHLKTNGAGQTDFTTATYADTYGASEILYSNGANTVQGLATANNATLITSGTGVPSISQTLPTAVQDNITQLGAQTEALDMGTNLISNVTDPAGAQDAATKNYVDTTAGGAGGSTTQIQYNNAGTIDGDSGFTTDGAGSVNITGDLDIDNLNINGNTITATDTNGNIVLAPDGSGITQTVSPIRIIGDSQVLSFGAGNDADIQYDGTDLNINPQTVGTGNIVQTAGNFHTSGISFDSGSNVLSKYTRIANWTPVPQGSSTAGSPVGTFAGKYVELNNDLVWFSCQIVFTDLDTMAGNFQIANFPVAANTGAALRAGITMSFRNNWTNDFVYTSIFSTSTVMNLYRADIDATQITISDLSATTNIYISGIYVKS